MAEITAAAVKDLREKSGAGMMDCKKALTEANGDMDAAMDWLRTKGLASAAKKSSRTAAEGLVGVEVSGTKGAVVEVNSETDFVAKNPEFVALARELAMQVAATNPAYTSTDEILPEAKQAATAVFEKEVADKPKEMQEKILDGKLASYFRDQVLLDQPFIKDETKTVQDLLNEATQKFGERVEVTRFTRLSAR